MRNFLQKIDPVLIVCFRIHDGLSGFLGRYMYGVKTSLLIVAHLSLIGIAFPEMRKDFGNLSAMLLIGLLFLSPLSKIFSMSLLLRLMAIRREMGILIGYWATVHVVGYFIDPQWFDMFMKPYLGWGLFSVHPSYLFGLGAYIFMLPLLLTSNTLSLRGLGGKNWKRLHCLVYVVLMFALLHRFTVKGMTSFALVQAGILMFAYFAVKWLARKNTLPSLVSVIQYVSVRYSRYKETEANI